MTVLHLRGATLPGDEVVDVYVADGVIRVEPVAGAETVVDGGWLLPGLVDMHAHPGSLPPTRPLDESALRSDAEADVDVGVAVLRSPGLAGDVPAWFRGQADMPRVFSAGAWLATGNRFFENAGYKVEEAELPAAAVAQVFANDGWCKVIGDWSFEDTPLPVDVMRDVVAAVHEVGGRVAVHCQTRAGCRMAVEAAVDTLEHGMNLEPDLIETMAMQGTAWVPTLSAFAGQAEFVRARPGGPRRDWWLGGYEAMRELVGAAQDAGVLVLAGTDTGPIHRVPDEIRLLAASGLPIESAIAAGSWRARQFLGLPSWSDGAVADVVAYDEDPRRNPDVLDHPARVILRGTVVR